MDSITYTPIGIIRSPFRELQGMPIQPVGARGTPGELVVAEEYAEGLRDLAGFSHVTILYHFHLSRDFALHQHPRGDKSRPQQGIFSLRTPKRPNPIGVDAVEILSMEGGVLRVRGLEAVNATPVLDIKPARPAEK